MGIAAVLLIFGGGCAPDPKPDELRELRLHQFDACPIPLDGTLDLTGLGDFPTATPSEDSLPLAGTTRRLRLPFSTAAVEAEANPSSGRWLGVGETDRSGLDLLMWPADRDCRVWQDSYPVAGAALGVGPAGALIAGGEQASSQSARAVFVSTRDGAVREVDGGLLPARALASVSPVGAQFVLAGGVDPREREDGDTTLATPLDTAIRFDVATERFLANDPIVITPRAAHGAVTLSSGDVLLVGGRSPQSPALRTLELIESATASARIAGLTQLSVRRSSPLVTKLSDGRILVGGGLDQSRAPVQSIELLSADASEHLGLTALVTSSQLQLTSLTAGSALLVGACRPDSAGCDPETSALYLDRDGALYDLPSLPEALASPMLLQASRGRAIWFNGSDPDRRGFVYSPWEQRFFATSQLGSVPPAAAAVSSVDGTAWLSADNGQIRTQRFDARNPWARDVGLLLLAQPDTDTTLVPNVPPGQDAPVDFDELGLRVSATGGVWMTDASYQQLRVELNWTGGPPPELRLRADDVQTRCDWPAATGSSNPTRLVAHRRGHELLLIRSDDVVTCEVGTGLLKLGVFGTGQEATRIAGVLVDRASR